jgi:hypothetical protein
MLPLLLDDRCVPPQRSPDFEILLIGNALSAGNLTPGDRIIDWTIALMDAATRADQASDSESRGQIVLEADEEA